MIPDRLPPTWYQPATNVQCNGTRNLSNKTTSDKYATNWQMDRQVHKVNPHTETCRQHFHMHFVEQKLFYFSWNCTELGGTNSLNAICCVATVCHQVRCMYWGHLGHCYRALSHLKWYKIVCMRYLACTFSQMKSITGNMFSMYLQSGVPRYFFWRFIAVTQNLTVFMFMYVNVDPKL